MIESFYIVICVNSCYNIYKREQQSFRLKLIVLFDLCYFKLVVSRSFLLKQVFVNFVEMYTKTNLSPNENFNKDSNNREHKF